MEPESEDSPEEISPETGESTPTARKIPETDEAYSVCSGRFFEMLWNETYFVTVRRRDQFTTPRDVEDAFYNLIGPSNVDKTKRIVSDAAMLLGGAALGFIPSVWQSGYAVVGVVAVLAVALAVVSSYMKYFDKSL